MRIVALEIARRRWRLRRPIAAAHAQWTDRAAALLLLRDESGRAGWGEAAPLPGHSRSSLDDAVADLERRRARTLGLDVDPAAGAAAVADALERVAPVAPAARFALETALLDLIGQARRLSVATLLRGGPPPGPVEVNALLGADAPAAVLAEAHAWFARGFRTFKLKVGRPGRWPEERAALAALRAEWGARIELRADVNGAWPLDDARGRLAQLAALGLQFVEQPVRPADLLHCLGAPTPLAADELLAEPGGIDLALTPGLCRAVVLKPMVLGGALRCLTLARRAADAGVDVVITSAFDGAVARAATTALALALTPAPLASGLAPCTREDPGVGAAWVLPPATVGLGLAPAPGGS